tara:strand:+ start:1235 stop:1531 length:297 start_codon:yes stop_codon:yes gene_type:complete
MNIGKGIKVVLSKRKLTQKDLAERSGMSETSISLLIKNKTQPRKETLDRIASVLDVKPEILMLLSVEKSDVPEERKDIYDVLWPNIESNLIHLFTESH